MMTIHSTYTSQFSPFKEWQGQSTTHRAPSDLSEGCCFWHSSANIRTLRRWWVYPCVQSWVVFFFNGGISVSPTNFMEENQENGDFSNEKALDFGWFWGILFSDRGRIWSWTLGIWLKEGSKNKLFLRFPVDLPSNMWPVFHGEVPMIFSGSMKLGHLWKSMVEECVYCKLPLELGMKMD